MKKSTEIAHGRTCLFSLHVHLVFVTKYRRKVFPKQVMEDLKEIFGRQVILLHLVEERQFLLFVNILKTNNLPLFKPLVIHLGHKWPIFLTFFG